MTASRPLSPPPSRSRELDLGGEAVHLFRFAAPAAVAYEYFLDVPAVLRLLPDALECRAYGPERYRLSVGATDGYGHTMAAIFDLQTELDHNRFIRVFPAADGPPLPTGGLVFAGALAAEAVFLDDGECCEVEYAVNIAMSIPIPGVLRLMPTQFLQNLGETAMELKMTQMINGFTRAITGDFRRWLAG